jgi:glyoxylase-like metal-dependent hydrolase (beta-lactamase superfamily II)
MMRHHPHAKIDVDELRRRMAEHQPVTILDVRTAEDRAEWSIPGSQHVDRSEALKAGDPEALAGVAVPSDGLVVTVCGAGNVSQVAAEHLRARGYDARSLTGGMKAWSLAWNSVEVPTPGSAATVIQVRRTGKGCLSYVVGSAGAAAVIDAAVEPAVYVDLAANHGWTITHVLDTHIHADHLSRSRALAELTGATLVMPAQDRVTYPFQPLHDGNSLQVGAASLLARHTPGHTDESTSYLLDGAALFTGDTLFLAGVGRPDLEASGAEAKQRAGQLYRSLRELATLPPETVVLPGHTSDPVPFDGRPLAATLGEVIGGIQMLRLSEAEFVATLLARIPPTPPNHARIVDLNEAGELPDGDPTDLEAGANRCAIA